MIAVQNVQETNLAWALIEVAKPHLNVLERNYVFVTTGAGDTFAAIHHLLKLIAVKGIPLRPSLVRLCVTWLDSYAFHDEERHLRRLIEGFLLPDAVRALTAVFVSPLSKSRPSTTGLNLNHRPLTPAHRMIRHQQISADLAAGTSVEYSTNCHAAANPSSERCEPRRI